MGRDSVASSHDMSLGMADQHGRPRVYIKYRYNRLALNRGIKTQKISHPSWHNVLLSTAPLRDPAVLYMACQVIIGTLHDRKTMKNTNSFCPGGGGEVCLWAFALDAFDPHAPPPMTTARLIRYQTSLGPKFS